MMTDLQRIHETLGGDYNQTGHVKWAYLVAGRLKARAVESIIQQAMDMGMTVTWTDYRRGWLDSTWYNLKFEGTAVELVAVVETMQTIEGA